ncbi:hypothetical protein BOTBODRAFT_121748 [Botryobasidium botryosum FD-172 SS1]|uniref:Uncharacterized protein n=1 Tax=Botryobasidium botryosum (strain FD-172 SS1) TaxID=930990 RepID=A0A067LT53_BOTB1|nr:hypothetical protein BOTBODRAFT_121748 [Botryobasidium botryosum FD-172 SS1]
MGLNGHSTRTPLLTLSFISNYKRVAPHWPTFFTPSGAFFASRFSSLTAVSSPPLPRLSTPGVSNWLLLSSALVFGIVVVGGVTRLTESGLSITEWRPIAGTLPPLTQEEWEVEFEKYKATPEFKILNHRITLSEFKRIFYMEYTHRLLGRIIGLTFVVPLTYFVLRKRLSAGHPSRLFGLSLLLGFQGFLGWYMVKSGLSSALLDMPNAHPRVSQYRLAAHLGAALALFVGMFGTGLEIRRDWRWVNQGVWSGVRAVGESVVWEGVLGRAGVRRFKGAAMVLTGLVFLTALSGAFVAGLDAGLVYNEFPLMGGRLAPPSTELFSAHYAKSADGSDLWWRNLLENPTTVQFDHRLLAMTTYVSTTALYLTTRLRSLRGALPPLTHHMAKAALAMVNLQVALGISTLLYLVPIPLAAAHQAGSVVLLSAMVALVGSLRRPSAAARVWREAKRAVELNAKRGKAA